jgi:hypothetical protein
VLSETAAACLFTWGGLTFDLLVVPAIPWPVVLLLMAYCSFHILWPVRHLASLNGRKPQLLIDPAVDLAAQPRFAFHRSWILPLHEPLRVEPWKIPLNEWERYVELPNLPFLNPQTQISANR